MRRILTALLFAPAVLAACAGNPDKRLLSELRDVEPDVREIRIEDGLDQAMSGYRRFLEEAPESALTPEAMRRLADLRIEKEYGILGDGGLAAPERQEAPAASSTRPPVPASQVEAIADFSKPESDLEPAPTGSEPMLASNEGHDLQLPGDKEMTPSAGPLEAIELYDQILTAYPTYVHNDQVLYQKARALDELGRNDEAIAVLEDLAIQYPHCRFLDEVEFRRAEYFFMRKRYFDAEQAYLVITEMGVASQYYELALYKLGWTFYKQEFHEEALGSYIALLDYKVSTGYDFDQSRDESDERRIADTFRVVSLSFSNLGGPDTVGEYFTLNGNRGYENRIYSHLGEFYFEKLRYNDAAVAYKTFVDLYPLHRTSPHFGMRVVEIYEAGGFPKLVVESKKQFAASYGLQSEYWLRFDIEESPEVVGYLKSNLEDLANHYHALYQADELSESKDLHFQEASRWYRDYLASFANAPETPAIHYRLADLLLESEHFGAAAQEYAHTAYEYPEHEQAAAAGYAAIFAHRKDQQVASPEREPLIRRDAVDSTLVFVETFPEHEHAAAVLGAAVDDLYDMKELEPALETGRSLLERYPQADPSIRRAAWAVVAHSLFDLSNYAKAEQAYARVLEMTPADDASHQAVVDSLAAAIYKQGEEASLAQEHRVAADHFLRIGRVAPSSDIRPAAEYDAGAALIRLEDWAAAASVLDSFRQAYPEHELRREATKQIAFVYREQGDLSRAATEYERVAAESNDPALRREALLLAGELYQDTEAWDRTLAVYFTYVQDFPAPLEDAIEVRFKIAAVHQAKLDTASYHAELGKIVSIDAAAGPTRTPRIRYLAAQSALVLSEDDYLRFTEIELVQPFDQNLEKKQKRMDTALEAFGDLLDYEVAEVTAAATFYMAELYFDFSQALLESERPADLAAGQMLDYEMVLEEEAFPFEEKAIEVHEKNLELMAAGIYNPWIEKSLLKLGALMPGRYAKFEASSGLIESIDSYAYEAPKVLGAAPVAADEATGAGELPPQPELDPEAESARDASAEGAAAAG